MSGVFLSYRREDSAGFAGRLADGLEAEFGAGSVFRDVDDIRPGDDFQLAIDSQLRSVDVETPASAAARAAAATSVMPVPISRCAAVPGRMRSLKY